MLRRLPYLLLLLFISLSCETTQHPDWPAGSLTTRPWTRWWWMGNAVDDANIRKQLIAYHKAGFGGVEITPIYGAVGYEDQYIDFLSEAWMDRLATVTRVSDSLSMGVDMNMGTGWPYGGPQISPQLAASKMVVRTYSLPQGHRLREAVRQDPGPSPSGWHNPLVVLMAYGNNEAIDLTDSLDEEGQLRWAPSSGDYELYAVFSGKTGQMVKRAAPGGAGYVLDHLEKQAFAVYTQRFDSAFNTAQTSIRSFFNDSYEVYGANFTGSLLQEFVKRRGYDLKPHLPLLTSADSSDTALRIKADYRKTLGELLLSNFTEPWKAWINENGALARNQAHGSPANLLDVYATADIPECETFGYTGFNIDGIKNYTHSDRHLPPDPFMLKFASSAANITGKPLTSSETFTWLGEHFKVPLSQTKPELDQAFLAGVNHVFYHGTTYSPKEAGWPGWLFYASTNFAPSNSWWPHIDGLNEYVNRCQSVLQAGKADSDLLIYFPYDDAVYEAGKRQAEYLFGVHNIDEWLHPTDFYKLSKELTQKGYLVDYVSDQLLEALQVQNGQLSATADGGRYKALIIPKMKFMPFATLQKIKDLMDNGAVVLFSGLPEDVPGFHELESKRAAFQNMVSSFSLATNLLNELSDTGIKPEPLVEAGLKYTKRVTDQAVYYFLVNHQPNPIEQFISLNTDFDHVIILDPLTGRAGNAETKDQAVRVQLKSGQSLLLKVGKTASKADWNYQEETVNKIALDGQWSIEFREGGPELPAPRSLAVLQPWTALGDSVANHFSGTAVYSTQFSLPEKAGDYLLRLGDVRESAKVWVNGEYVGNSWSVPHELLIGEYLQVGENTIEIEVANLMANRIRYMDRAGIEWRRYHEINFVNIDYKSFDASEWQVMASGLTGPVSIAQTSGQ